MYVTWRVWKLGCITCEPGRRPMPYSSQSTSLGFGSRIGSPWMKPTMQSPNRQKQCWCVPSRTEKAASCAAAETAIAYLLSPCVHLSVVWSVVAFARSRWSIVLQRIILSEFDADVCAFISGLMLSQLWSTFFTSIMHLLTGEIIIVVSEFSSNLWSMRVVDTRSNYEYRKWQ